jgi:hypothetical protein
MSVFDDAERQAQIFNAALYLERNAARRKAHRTTLLSAISLTAGVWSTVAMQLWSPSWPLLLRVLPLVLGACGYIAGRRYCRSVVKEHSITDPDPLLGVVRSSSEMM